MFHSITLLQRFWFSEIAYNVGRLCAGVGIEFRRPVTEVLFIIKSSLFVLLPGIVRQPGTTAEGCT